MGSTKHVRTKLKPLGNISTASDHIELLDHTSYDDTALKIFSMYHIKHARQHYTLSTQATYVHTA